MLEQTTVHSATDTKAFRVVHTLADALIGLALFAAVTIFTASHGTMANASPHSIATAQALEASQPVTSVTPTGAKITAPAAAMTVKAPFAGSQNPSMSWLLLGLVFSALAAFNLGFLRHLRRVYAAPRTDGWRRG